MGTTGEDKASSIIDRICLVFKQGLKHLSGWTQVLALSSLPRTSANYRHRTAYLDPINQPSWRRFRKATSDIVMRIATLDGIQPSALSELDEMMEKRFAGNSNVKTSSLGGPKVAASIMNLLDSTQSTVMMDNINKADEQLATKIQDLMFVFDNLLEIDDRGMQELLRGVASDQLLLALKGADDRMKEKVFANMSQRAAEMLRDDLAARGPVKLSDVEAAQKEILSVARKMAEAGTLALGGSGEEYV